MNNEQLQIIRKSMSENESDMSELPYVLFCVGENTYGINSRYVISIENLHNVTSIVDSEPHIRGGVIFDNSFISLISMRKLFGLDEEAALPTDDTDKKEVYIVIKNKEGTMGLIVDSIAGIEDFNYMIPFPSNLSKSRYITSVCKRAEDKSIVLILDILTLK